jgi:23S rRNA (cytosine1962-C5)-methyltransferase
VKTFKCILKKGKEKPLQGRHPWVFSGAIDQIEEGLEAGDLVSLFSAGGDFLGTGYINPASQIAVRVLEFGKEPVGEALFEKKLRAAAALRETFGILNEKTTACRLVHSEGDFLPGLIVDKYGDTLVAQFLTAGMERWKETLAGLLEKVFKPEGIFERSDSDMREKEGLEKRSGLLAGKEPPAEIEILENGHVFLIDVRAGQKTGFFLDQRENRASIGALSQGRKVLNCFSYTGGFSVYAAKAGASRVVSVELSQPAQDTARKAFERNGLKGDFEFVREDVFDYLRKTKETFDLIVLDPPAFCKTKGQVPQACRGYKDINLCALKKLAPGGLLFTASCSTYMTPDLFQKVVFGAAKDAGRDLRIVRKTSHAPDHPVSIFHPEGEYLKGLLCQVL